MDNHTFGEFESTHFWPIPNYVLNVYNLVLSLKNAPERGKTRAERTPWEPLGCCRPGAMVSIQKLSKNLQASEFLMHWDSPYKPYWRRNRRIIEICQVCGRQLAVVTGHYCHIWQCLQACQVRNRVQRLGLSRHSQQFYYKQRCRAVLLYLVVRL